MSNLRRHARNGVVLVFSGGVAKILVFLATIQIIKALKVGDNGILQLGLSIGFIFSIITEVGFRGYVVRELARVRDDREEIKRLYSRIFFTRIIITAGLAPLAYLVLHAIGYSPTVRYFTLLFTVYTLLDSTAMLVKYAIRAFERMQYEAVFTTGGRAILVVGITLLGLSDRLNLFNVAIVHIVSAAAEAIGLMIVAHRVFGLKLTGFPTLRAAGELIMKSYPFAVTNLVGLLYIRTGTLLLSKMSGEEAVAFFNTAGKLPEALTFVPLAAVNAVVPFLSRNPDDTALLNRYTQFLVRYVGFMASAIGVFLFLEPEWVIKVLARPEYLAATAAFSIFGLWAWAVFIQFVLANLLICLNDEKYVMNRYTVALIANLLLNLILIPKLNVTGAALALLLTECVALVFDWRRMSVRGIRLPIPLILQSMVPGVAAGVVLLAGRGSQDFVRIGMAGGLAGLIIVVFAMLHDRRIIKQLLRRNG